MENSMVLLSLTVILMATAAMGRPVDSDDVKKTIETSSSSSSTSSSASTTTAAPKPTTTAHIDEAGKQAGKAGQALEKAAANTADSARAGTEAFKEGGAAVANAIGKNLESFGKAVQI